MTGKTGSLSQFVRLRSVGEYLYLSVVVPGLNVSDTRRKQKNGTIHVRQIPGTFDVLTDNPPFSVLSYEGSHRLFDQDPVR